MHYFLLSVLGTLAKKHTINTIEMGNIEVGCFQPTSVVEVGVTKIM
jgi:hypothetical protein